jgi:Ca2+-binding RTX toxin-like protein
MFSLQTQGAPQLADPVTGYQLNLQGTFRSVYLGSGNDNVSGNATLGTYINGGAGSNTLTGGSGNDSLVGGTSSFNDVLTGMGGNDALYGGIGSNILNDTFGFNTFKLAPRTVTSNDLDTVIENGGMGTLNFSSFTDAVTINLQTQGQPQLADVTTGYQLNLRGTFGTVVLGSGNNVIIGNETIASHIIGGSGNNVIIGGDKGDQLVATGAGQNVLVGMGGNDTLTAGAGYDVLIGGSGKSILNGSAAGNDLLIGGSVTFGTVSFASNQSQYITDLQSMSALWGNGTLFAIRMSSLRAVLAVTNSAFSDTLNGGSAPTNGFNNDWFWGNTGLDKVVNFQSGDQLN